MKMYPVLKNHTIKMYGWVEVQLHTFLTLLLHGGEWSASQPACFTPRERVQVTHWIGGWVSPRAGLDVVTKRKIPSSCQESNPGCPTHSPVTILTELPWLMNGKLMLPVKVHRLCQHLLCILVMSVNIRSPSLSPLAYLFQHWICILHWPCTLWPVPYFIESISAGN